MSFTTKTSGTTNALTKYTGPNTLGNSNETDDGTTFTVGKRTAFTPVTKTFSGTQNDYDVGDAVQILLVVSSTPIITGLANGTNGRIVRLISDLGNSDSVLLASQHTGSIAANRFVSAVTISPGKAVDIVYDGSNSRWVSLSTLDGSGTPQYAAVWGFDTTLGDFPMFTIPLLVGEDLSVDSSLLNSGSFIPSLDDTTSLGSPTNRWKFAIPSQYDSVPVAGKGVVPIHDVVQLTGQTSTQFGTFANSTVAGVYRAQAVLVSHKDGTPVASGISTAITYTDTAGNPISRGSAVLDLSTADNVDVLYLIFKDGSGDIGWAANYSLDGTYDLTLTLEKLSD